tara:strand:- start:29682 stop:31376 length:1695 start_codon:yes stop_codon:yes gene_type:complete
MSINSIKKIASIGFILVVTVLQAQRLEVTYRPYEELAMPIDERIDEASGIAASLYVPGAFWVHNDSGDAANIFLCNPDTGETINSGLVENAKNRDWEDISSFRMNGKSYLIIASFGDNKRKRNQYQLYIMEEPVVDAKGPFPFLNAIKYTYEGGKSYNCESVAVDVTEGRIYLLTKTGNSATSQVYSLPLSLTSSNNEQVAKLVGCPNVKLATGMDISPDGKRAVVITNKNNQCQAFQFTKLPGQTWEQGFLNTPKVFKTPIRPTYEAICFALDGETLYDKSEKGNFGKFSVVNQNATLTIQKGNRYVAAHRGGYENEYADKAPENSIANIQNAMHHGFEIYESDVHRTADGVFIIMHDPTFDRTTNGTGDVNKTASADLKKYQLTYYNGEVSNEPIPLLEDFISKGDGNIIFKIDYKAELIYLKDFILQIQTLQLQKRVILRLGYRKKTVKELEGYNLDEIPHILFRVEKPSQFEALKKEFDPRMISIITKENTFNKGHLEIIKEASDDNILIEAHTFNDHKDNRETYWKEQVKLPISIFHTKKPLLFKAFLEKQSALKNSGT